MAGDSIRREKRAAQASPTARKGPGRKPKPARNGSPRAAAEVSPEAPGPDDEPFDAAFFRTQFPNLLQAREAAPPRSFVVTLVLGDGVVQYDVSHIEELDRRWAVFAVYDRDSYREATGATHFVFVPYGAIARIEVTGLESRVRPIGFHLRPVPKPAARRKAAARRVPKKRAATRRKKD